jgi:prephenate dehydrogenase
MGGSLALALKRKCAALYGIDSDPATLELALAKQIVDQADASPVNVLPQVDLVILAAPIPAIIDWIQRLPALTENRCIVLDLGSTKTEIVRSMSNLPECFDPIGGHPICGKENLGLENADGRLFENAPFIITPLERTTQHAFHAIQQILMAIGARRIDMDAETHDYILAYTSHLPFLLSSALALSTPAEYSPLIGTGFRSTSRLAGTASSMTLGILQSNRENVLHALSIFQKQLSEIQTKLAAEDFRGLEGLLNQSRDAYQSLVSDPHANHSN